VEASDPLLVAESTGLSITVGGAPCVASEVGRLRSVLLHRPGDELRAIEPANAARMLFAGPVDVEAAQAEHDALASTLRARGVEVVYVETLLTEIAGDQQGRRGLLELALPHAPASLRRRLGLLASGEVVRALIGGLYAGELALSTPTGGRARLLGALPNLMFVRDPSAWIGRGAVVGAMAMDVRAREADLVEALYRLHPRFAGAPAWTDTLPVPTRVEGGDVLVVSEDRVMVGISPRTSVSGAHRLATALLFSGVATEVLTVTLPRGAAFHLDLVATMVDRETFAVWAPVRHALRAHRWRATSSGVAVCAVPDPLSWLSASTRVIEIGSRTGERHGRAWDHGVNVLALAPGVVLAYEDNRRANAQLAAAGIEVIPMTGAALARGRGGPRCLSCPLVRDEVGP
jgi:arginine deiminase